MYKQERKCPKCKGKLDNIGWCKTCLVIYDEEEYNSSSDKHTSWKNDYYESRTPPLVYHKTRGWSSTYEERYKGTSYDLGPDWDYNEYPPENL